MAPTYGTNVPKKVTMPSSTQASIPAMARPTVSTPMITIETKTPPTQRRSVAAVRAHHSSNSGS